MRRDDGRGGARKTGRRMRRDEEGERIEYSYPFLRLVIYDRKPIYSSLKAYEFIGFAAIIMKKDTIYHKSQLKL